MRNTRLMMRIKAITFDLDDTLWPIAPAMQHAENSLHAWLLEHCPRTAQAHPSEAMRALRDRVARDNPHLAHDFSAQRRLSLQEALLPHGYSHEHVEAAFSAFYAGRNRVECYGDALPALRRLAARYPLAAITNGNADIDAIGLAHLFRFSLRASDFGAAKPAAAIFHDACRQLDLAPEHVLHVGDDVALDVIGAHQAGLRSVWLNRTSADWDSASAAHFAIRANERNDGSLALAKPDLIVRDLAELADALDKTSG